MAHTARISTANADGGRGAIVAKRSALVFIVIFLALIPALFRPRVYGFDPVGYYSWARTLVVDGNLDTMDEYLHYGNGAIAGRTPTGYNHNPYSVGAPLLWLPFMVAGQAMSGLAASLAGRPAPDGYGDLTILVTGLASLVYGFAAVWLLRSVLRARFSAFAADAASAVIWLASSWVFYMYAHPLMAHPADVFANVLVVAAWVRLSARPGAAGAFVLGLAIGVAFLVRAQNAVIAVFPAAWLVIGLARGARSGEARAWLTRGLAYAAGGLLGALPQLIVWQIVYGSWLQTNPYDYSGAGNFTSTFAVLRVLFSTDRGLFLWHPALLFGFAGLLLMLRRERLLPAFLLFHFGTQLALVSAWAMPTGALAFGARLLMQSLPAFGVGLAACVDWLLGRGVRRRVVVAAAAILVIWNMLLIAQYAVGTIPRGDEFPLSQLIIGQFTVIPQQFERILRALLTRM